MLAVVTLSSCAGVVNVQPQVNGLAVIGRYDEALAVLDPAKYGKNNELLYLLDKGMVLHLSGRYEESSQVFEQAKLRYEELYTKSVSKETGSWLWNDYTLPYRGEDFERVMVNIFEALNYAAMDNIEDALVEANDVDSILNAINHQYNADQKNVYRDDAFARLLMGILYEAGGKLNDAVISYRQSWRTYQKDYKTHYGLDAPAILKENLLAAGEKFGDSNMAEYRKAFAGVSYVPWDDKQMKARVFVIEYQGLSPVKVPVQVPIPLPGGYISQIAFPAYQGRSENFRSTEIGLTAANGVRFSMMSEAGEDIDAIAVKNLADRKVRVIAKAIARMAGKYALERGLQSTLEKDHGQGTGGLIPIIGSLYNFISERADLRSWQTLPAQIRIGQIIVVPGMYNLTVGSKDFGSLSLKAGENKFYIVRTLR